MLKGAFNHAASVAGSVVAGYAARASTAVPFIIGFAFATAALTLLLIDRFGHRDAYLILAGVFALLGSVAALIVRARERGTEQEVGADATSAKITSKPVFEDAAARGAVAMPFAVLGAVLTALGPAPFLSLLGILGRSLPLVLALGATGALVWRKGPHATQAEANLGAIRTEPTLAAVEAVQQRSMALGTFVIIALLVGAAISVVLGPIAPALPAPFVIS